MQVFVGSFAKGLDDKKRLQIPSHFCKVIHDGKESEKTRLYVTLGRERGTLSIFTEERFEELVRRMETEYIPGDDARRFELQFYAMTRHVEMDKQGRLTLPDDLAKKANLGSDMMLVGQKNHIDVWNRERFEAALGIDWEGDAWPDWEPYLRLRPGSPATG
jgi:MraZ protein